MKFLLFSTAGEGAQILKWIQDEGNEVGIYITEKEYQGSYKGILDHVEPDDFIDDDTVIIFDLTGNGKEADNFRKRGHLVYGASALADALEHDRELGLNLMESVGINIPQTLNFSEFQAGVDFLLENDYKRYVFKPSGDEMPCKLTFAADDAEELIQYMKFVERKFGKQISDFVLQEFVEGVCVSTEFFCDGKKFIRPANHTVEVKKHMNNDLGPSTGCAGNIVWIPEDDDDLVKEVLKAEEFFVNSGYVGQVDLNAALTKSGEIFGLEWTPRVGYDATPTLLKFLGMEVGKFFSDITRGQLSEIPLERLYMGGIRISIPPYPAEPKGNSEKLSPNIGVPIQGHEPYEGSIYFFEVMEEEDQLVHSGGTGVIACVTSSDEDVDRCLSDAYYIAKELKIPDKQYRTDLDEVLPEMIKEVHEYATR